MCEEAWAKKTFIAAVIGAVFLGILATISVVFTIDYLRMRWAMDEARESFQKAMKPEATKRAAGLTFDPARGIEELKSRFGSPPAATAKKPGK